MSAPEPKALDEAAERLDHAMDVWPRGPGIREADVQTLLTALSHYRALLGEAEATGREFLDDVIQRAEIAAEHPNEAIRTFFKDKDGVMLPCGNGVLFNLRTTLSKIREAIKE